jgi:anti-sigma regulatory factor (Ser/Thr protein kinase)
MAGDAEAAQWATAARERLVRPPVARRDGDGSRPRAAHDAMSFSYTTDLAAIRAVVHRYAIKAGLSEARAIDLVLAVSEVAANTVQHAKSPGSLQIWYDEREIVCQIHDEGFITDPQAGRRKPSVDDRGGHGLWIVRQVCDRVDIRSDESGTTIRLHMNLPSRPGAPAPGSSAPGPAR